MNIKSKAVQGSARDDDAELLDLCRTHQRLWRQWGRADDAMETADLMDRCEWLSRKIIGIPAFTVSGLAAKRRVMRQSEFDDPCRLIESILDFDAERVAAR